MIQQLLQIMQQQQQQKQKQQDISTVTSHCCGSCLAQPVNQLRSLLLQRLQRQRPT
jgi:hypothetical protein